jgi:ATP-dependent Lon protease
MKLPGAVNLFTGLKGKPPREPATNLEALLMLPLRELVLFPNVMAPVFITYKTGINALDEALKTERRLFAVCVKEPETGEPYQAGTVVRVIQHLKLPDASFRVVLQGEYRALIHSLTTQNEVSLVKITPITAPPVFPAFPSETPELEVAALMRSIQKSFAQYAEFTKKVSTETLTMVEKTDNPERLANIVSNAVVVKPARKIELLGITGTVERLEKVLETLETENEIFSIQKNISGKIKTRMDKSHRDYILHEQLKEINKELGTPEDELADLERTIEAKKPGEEVLAKTRKELKRLRKLQPLSPESGILRAYLEWMSDLPWTECSTDSNDLNRAGAILDRDHFGMRKAKERILEFIAVRQLISLEAGTAGKEVRGPILCFVGPPGTGKTSLGESVAHALDRRFVRISLGGIRDEAEIRGHRKTYVGALPGKIIQSMRKAGTVNPVFLLDEIDKMSSDFRGDPASALLEVLDPQQNFSFMDHYLEVPFDLSRVLFIATANSVHTIPYPLLDRMEIIEIPGYGESEKLAIAKQFLIPAERVENGLEIAHIIFKDETIRAIIRYWTMESGVRNLERELARCMRRIAQEAVKKGYGKDKPLAALRKTVKPTDLETLLNRRKYKNDVFFKEARAGVSYGLAWTETGGAILPVETICFEGSGKLTVTGNLGEVMKESASIALSYIRSVQSRYNVQEKDVGKTDFHLHVPEGAIPKDGPSAGVTLAASILSALCGTPPKAGIAMTGELTLTGRILPIGGLKEKVLAAIRTGMEKVLVPLDNRENWDELDRDIVSALEVVFVESAEAAFRELFDGCIFKPLRGEP